MKKYKCSGCSKPCFIQVEDEADCPIWCAYAKGEITDWCEVEEVVTDCSQLPDWCKAGEWVYDYKIGEYAIVKKEENPQWYLDNLETLSPARKRPFNIKEMKALVGKVIEKDNNLYLVTAYYNDKQTIITSNASSLLDAELLIVNNFTIDGKPCYVMEHKNDKGEWVQ
jgi:hypothetical protein